MCFCCAPSIDLLPFDPVSAGALHQYADEEGEVGHDSAKTLDGFPVWGSVSILVTERAVGWQCAGAVWADAGECVCVKGFLI